MQSGLEQPRVSVVVPVFNGRPFLAELVQSLLAQDYPNLDIVFSDGGSSDGSVEYLKAISDPRVRVIEQPVGTTAAENWTAASAASVGEFTKLICQDDLLYPSAITHQVQDLLEFPESVMAVALRDIVDARGTVRYRGRGLAKVARGIRTMTASSLIRSSYLAGTNVIGEPLAVLFRTTSLLHHLPWRDDNPLMLDLSMYERVASDGTAVVRWESVGAFRVSGASWSTRLAREQGEQTRRWQHEFANGAQPPVSTRERFEAHVGRHRQILTRRVAYAVLGWQGALAAPKRG